MDLSQHPPYNKPWSSSPTNQPSKPKLMFVKKHALIGKLIRHHTLNTAAFYAVLSRAWSLNGPKKIQYLGNFVFLFLFHNVHDKEQILSSGPWSFMDSLLVLKEWPSSGKIADVDFSTSMFWVQAHNLPGDMRDIDNAIYMSGFFSKFLECSESDLNRSSLDGFMRFKVEMDISKPLKKGCIVHSFDKNPLWVQFKYERLPVFCFYCGIIGHDKYNCFTLPIPNRAERYGLELKGVQPCSVTHAYTWDKLFEYVSRSVQSSSAAVYEPSPSERLSNLITVPIIHFDGRCMKPGHPYSQIDLPAAIIKSLASQDNVFPANKPSPPAELELPPIPKQQEFPDDPTDQEWEYIQRHAFSMEEYEEYRAELEDIPEDFINDEEIRCVRKLYLDVERVVKRFRHDLNAADRAWYNEARKYLKIVLQNQAYPIEEGVWDIEIIALMKRDLLMTAVLDDSDDDD